MEEAFIDLLLENPAVSSIVGTKVRPVVRGQNDNPPCVVLTRISGFGNYHNEGQSDLTESRVQVDCYGMTPKAASDLARAVKFAVPKRPFGKGGVDFGGIFYSGERATYEGDVPSSRVHRRSLDFRVWHSEP